MRFNKNCILIINVGSSSIKFAVYDVGSIPTLLLHGIADIKKTDEATFSITDAATNTKKKIPFHSSETNSPEEKFLKQLEQLDFFSEVVAIGHRIVQGWNHTAPEKITPKLLQELKQIIPFDPEHLPAEIAFIEIFTKYYPDLLQVACFDTSFHASMPAVAKMLPLPRRFMAKGIQRYGFHGLSYTFIMAELSRINAQEALGKIIIAHLGNGASLAAVNNGKSIDTTMGFTPASGLMMGTRSGDMDPGVAWYLMSEEKMNPETFNHFINHESGLLGVSETSADMQQLLTSETTDARAAEAIQLFCYQAIKHVGAFAAVLNGLDTFIFCGGIGEHAGEIRKRICSALEYLGVAVDDARNNNNEAIISSSTSKVTVRVMNTNEESVIATSVLKLLNEQR